MPTVQQLSTKITGARAISIRPIGNDGNEFNPTPDATWLYGVTQVPVQLVIEQGERVVDKADGVGVIAVHEEDDTLIGADLEVTGNNVDFLVLSLIVGGTLALDVGGNITSWTPPTIDQQRDAPKRFELDIYAVTDNGTGFIRHRFLYCRGMQSVVNYGIGLSQPGLTVKARPNPITGLTHTLEYVSSIPDN